MPDEKKEKKPTAPVPTAAIKPRGKKKKLSVLKRIRQDKKKKEHNHSIMANLKALLKKVNTAIIAKEKEKAIEAFRLVTSALDKAALKKIIHKNKAARHKSTLGKRLHQLLTA